jgi:hypothetical protein
MRFAVLFSILVACSGRSHPPLDDAPLPPLDASPDASPQHTMRAPSVGIVPAGGTARSEKYRFVGSLSPGTQLRSETRTGATGVVGGGQ